MSKKIVYMVFKGPGKEYAPEYKDVPKGVEVWGVNNSIFDRKMDKCFYLHYPEDTAEYREIRLEGNAKEITIVCQDKLVGWDKQEKYPFSDIVKKYGVGYFSNSIAFMIAYAMYNDFKEIHIWGAPLDSQAEYIFEKAGVEYWIGYAMGLGVKVVVHGLSTIMRTKDDKVYGWDKKLGSVVRDWKVLYRAKDLLSLAKR